MGYPAATLSTIAGKFDSLYIPEPNSGCWLWEGYLAEGYGQIRCEGKYQGAHRLSYRIHKGDIPDGLYVLHHCDNPICVNPEHLFVGTAADNNKDCISKNRRPFHKGAAHWNCKLSDAAVVDIKTKRLRSSEFAALYKVGARYILEIWDGAKRK